MRYNVGIGITTRNRSQTLQKTLDQIRKHTPEVFTIVVVDDASDDVHRSALVRFKENVGVARAKNACLSLLSDCDHIFLFDDDTFPIGKDWWKPYVEHPEPHLMYQFKLPNKPKTDMQELYRDEKTVAYSHTRGAMIYIDRKVLSVVGGFDTKYGLGGFEHPDWTNRIHNAGLTTHRAMDIPNSCELLYCLDQDSRVESTIPKDIKLESKNYRYYRSQLKSKEYKEYR